MNPMLNFFVALNILAVSCVSFGNSVCPDNAEPVMTCHYSEAIYEDGSFSVCKMSSVGPHGENYTQRIMSRDGSLSHSIWLAGEKIGSFWKFSGIDYDSLGRQSHVALLQANYLEMNAFEAQEDHSLGFKPGAYNFRLIVTRADQLTGSEYGCTCTK